MLPAPAALEGSSRQMGVTEPEQLLVSAPVALTPAAGWRAITDFQSWWLDPHSAACLLLAPHSQFPPDCNQNSPSTGNPSLAVLRRHRGQLGLGENSQVLLNGWSPDTG